MNEIRVGAHAPQSNEGDRRFDGSNVTAVLGPTNTGKTFLAIERMVSHSSGTIGLPLRLLAREVYQKVCDRVGEGAVSLITGEEKIKPPNARYAVCTVEAMPRDPGTAFVAIDEVQLASDLERGHVFTDRILNTRGREETLLLGASTMEGVLKRLLRGVEVVTRPRLSNLLYAGSKKITRLPRRTAIVAFSAGEVYAIAELIRRQRGGAAVVLGALSPRTRNAQVELYQSGEVDFLVATDAIGMGLNLDVDHVAFAQDWKFDGFQFRQLTPAEYGQIAGRAGRHVRDGTFGVTGQVDPLTPELAESLETHEFAPVRVLQWRNGAFDFSSVEALKASLEIAPPIDGLARSLPGVDQRALDFLSRDPETLARATNARRVELLWEACKLPDYRRIAPAQHAEIIASIYGDLADRGHVAEDYMASQVRRADRTDGDLDTLSQRIAEIRTWTYISHRPGWLADPSHWQEKTRAIEDRLSDALHDRLTQRFVDRRTSVLMRRLRENAVMEAEVSGDGSVAVEGHTIGSLDGFRFTPDSGAEGADGRAVRAAAEKALASEFEKRAERFTNAPNSDMAIGSDGVIRWLGSSVAVLIAGEVPLSPRTVLLADDQLNGPAREAVAARADRFVAYQITTVLKPLVDLQNATDLEGTARGIAYRLVENFGLIERREIAEEVRALDQKARATMRRYGVRFGAYHIFVPTLVKPAPAQLLTLLWATFHDGRDKPGYGDVTQLLSTGRTSTVADESYEPIFWRLAGYRRLGRRAVRVDILERLADLIRPAIAWKPGEGRRPDGAYEGQQFLVTPGMMSILGATAEDMEEILKGLGYRADTQPAASVENTIAEHDAAAEAAALAAVPAARGEAAAAPAEAASGEDAAAAPGAEILASAADPAGETTAAPVASEADALSSAAVGADAPQPTGHAPEAETPDDAALGEAPRSGDVGDTQPDPARETAPSKEEATVAGAEDMNGQSIEQQGGEAGMAATPVSADTAPTGSAGEQTPSAETAVEAAPAAGETVETASDEPERTIQVWRLQRSNPRGQNNRRGSGQRGGGHRGSGQRAAGQRGAGQASDHEATGSEAKGPRNKPQRGKGGGRPDGDRKPAANANGGGKGAANGKPRGRPDRRIDPEDSPFGKLAALRDKLKN